MDVDRSSPARARHRRHLGRPHARRRARRDTGEEPGGVTLVTNAGSNSKFLGVLDFDVKDGKIADFRYKLPPIFSNLLPADAAMDALITKNPRALRSEAQRQARHHRCHALPSRQFQRFRLTS